MMTTWHTHTHTHKLRILLFVGGLLGAAAGVWWLYVRPYYTIHITPRAEIAVSRRGATDERRPTIEESQRYVVPSEEPRYLRIGKLGVDARVLRVDKDDDGKIAAPDGVWDVGWYQGSVRPGEDGVSFIDGHISGPTLPAVFKDLHRLQSGDVVDIERGDGASLRYRVVSVQEQQLDEVDMNELLAKPRDSRPTLVLMTCGGNFDRTTYTYDKRVVVISTLL